MRQAQKKKEKDRVAIALVLAFCVIALTSIFTIKSNIDKINGRSMTRPIHPNWKTNPLLKQMILRQTKPMPPKHP